MEWKTGLYSNIPRNASKPGYTYILEMGLLELAVDHVVSFLYM